jgi:hypothetical protein
MEETYTVCGGLQVAGKGPGETVTRKELEDLHVNDENLQSLIGAGLIELDKKPVKTTAKTKTGE